MKIKDLNGKTKLQEALKPEENQRNYENSFLGGMVMKKKISMLLCAALTVASLVGCGGKETENATNENTGSESAVTESSSETTAKEATEVKIWHDGDEAIMQTIADCVNEQLASEQITVVFEKKSGLTDQLKLYGNDEANGPDMYLYAHDSLGAFAEMGILAPITDVMDETVLNDGLNPRERTS